MTNQKKQTIASLWLALGFSAPMLLVACGGEKSTRTAADEKSEEGGVVRAKRVEDAPKPPSDEEMKAKQAAAAEKAKKASANDRAEFAALVEKYEKAKSTPPGIPANDCSWARKFSSYGNGPFAAQAHFNAGTILEGCGNEKGAEDEYNEALKANPGYGPALTNLGNLYFKRGNVQTARQWFEKVVHADASMQTAAAYNNLALILYSQAHETGDASLYKEAVRNLRRALAIDSNSVAAYALLAQIYYTTAENDRSKLDLAALVCKQAKETDDKYAPIYNTLGLINLKKKNVTGALKEFEKAVELDPKFVEAHLNIGAIALSSRQYEKAQKSFSAVLALQPNNFDATVGMGVAVRGIGSATKDPKKYDEAEQYYQKAQQLNSKNCTITYNLGLLYQDYKVSEDNSNLRKAQDFFRNFSGCGNADKKKVEDATRRIKDIDDTFAAIEEQKKMEAEAKKMQEEADRMQKQMEEQQKADEAKAKAAEQSKAETPKK